MPLLLIVVFLSEFVHEAGHAIAAALHRIEPEKVGLSILFPCLPVAHVMLPDRLALPRIHLARVISAGVWHNAVLVIVCVLIQWVGSLFLTDAGGLVVTKIRDASLASYFSRGRTITQLNDQPLRSLTPAQRTETWLLFTEHAAEPEHGWCMDASDWSWAEPHCDSSSSLSLFATDHNVEKCMDPMAVMTESRPRCLSTKQCGQAVCIRPAISAPLARVYTSSDDMVVLRGSLRSLRTSMSLTQQQLGGPFRYILSASLRTWLVQRLHTLLSFFIMVNMALVGWNMLPLPFLDGSAYLRLVLVEYFARQDDRVSPSYMAESDDEEETLEASSTEHTVLAAHVRSLMKLCERGVLLLTGTALIGSIWVTLSIVSHSSIYSH